MQQNGSSRGINKIICDKQTSQNVLHQRSPENIHRAFRKFIEKTFSLGTDVYMLTDSTVTNMDPD
ncbi:hypothetical protein CHS0354_020303 [Potamilus streckersoni]|uniref:Uncharacterized protein n=1 Tax=Potamilus streckersoni TaxID=2493646 RepID=A0AAE0VPS5_9BIVA|nr:hypothetical protein CHS0354_020303 [Potamilus streckersoni]